MTIVILSLLSVRFRCRIYILHKLDLLLTMDFHKKRKVDSEHRAFNKDWMPKYFFTEIDNKGVCLLCNQSVAVLKEYNISCHYATKHGNCGNNVSEAEWQTRATELDRKLARQQSVLAKSTLAQKSSTHASFKVAYHIAKHKKTFSDGEFIKKCMLDVAVKSVQKNDKSLKK